LKIFLVEELQEVAALVRLELNELIGHVLEHTVHEIEVAQAGQILS